MNYDRHDQQHINRLREKPGYQDAIARCQAMIDAVARELSKRRLAYDHGSEGRIQVRGYYDATGNAGVIFSAKPAITKDGGVSSTVISVRVYDTPGRVDSWTPCLYHANVRHYERAVPNICHHIEKAAKAHRRLRRPNGLELAAERTAAARTILGPGVRTQGSEARIDYARGRRIQVTAGDDHAVTVSGLDDKQLQVVLRLLLPLVALERS